MRKPARKVHKYTAAYSKYTLTGGANIQIKLGVLEAVLIHATPKSIHPTRNICVGHRFNCTKYLVGTIKYTAHQMKCNTCL